jgi:hypothetical protein
MTIKSCAVSQQDRTGCILRRTAFTAVFSALLMPLGMTTATGQVIIEVQEDWELVIADPDSNSSGPQVTCIISPYSHVESLHAALELNQQTYPHYTPGGVQLHTWNGDFLVNSMRFPSDEVLSSPDETITWTQRMAINGSQVIFDVDNAVSTTWGNFGSNGHLWISTGTSLANLNDYSPDVSVEHSGVGYAANRVQRLVLKEVRRYTAQGLHSRDTTARVVHELSE